MLLQLPSCGVAQCASVRSPPSPSSSHRIQLRRLYGAVQRRPVQRKTDGPIQSPTEVARSYRKRTFCRVAMRKLTTLGTVNSSSVFQCMSASISNSKLILPGVALVGYIHRVSSSAALRAAIATGGRTQRTPSVIKAVGGGAGNQTTFLSYEEAGLIEMSKLDMHERFLCRLTVSSLNLLRIISEQEGVPIEQLNAGLICDWFQKDKVKREQDINSATLKWEPGPEW